MKKKISPVKSPSTKPSVQFDSSPINSSPSVDFCSPDITEYKNPRGYHPKRVVTPDWIKEDPMNAHVCGKVEATDQQKMIDVHFELEVLERRIEYCIDTKHGHPALCVKVREEEGISDITRKEKKLRNNYTFIPPVNVIPGFWVPRIYDKPENKMSKEESKALQTKIKQASLTKSHSQMVTRMHSWNSENPGPNPFFSYADDNDFNSDADDYNMGEDIYSPQKNRKAAQKKKNNRPSRTNSTPTLTPGMPGTIITTIDGVTVIKRKRGRPRKYPLPEDLISISLKSFATDDEDNHTDWEDDLL